VPSSTSSQQPVPASTKSGRATWSAPRGRSSDDRRRRRDSGGGKKKTGDGAAPVDSGNWELKSTVGKQRGKNVAKPAANSGVDGDTKKFSSMNGHAATAAAERTDLRGQTSAELKKRRSAQRHSANGGGGGGLIAGHDDWLSSPSVVDKKLESVAIGSATTFKRNSRRRCIVM